VGNGDCMCYLCGFVLTTCGQMGHWLVIRLRPSLLLEGRRPENCDTKEWT